MDKEFLDSKTETSGCTLEEYKYIYPRLMGDFTKQYDDYDELTYIDRQIENHSIIMNSCKNGMERISDFDFRRENFDLIEENCGQDKFLEMMSYYEKRASSHKAIISFLETKKVDIYKVQALPIQQTENKNMTNDLFTINKKNF
jgi:hypothetical protein